MRFSLFKTLATVLLVETVQARPIPLEAQQRSTENTIEQLHTPASSDIPTQTSDNSNLRCHQLAHPVPMNSLSFEVLKEMGIDEVSEGAQTFSKHDNGQFTPIWSQTWDIHDFDPSDIWEEKIDEPEDTEGEQYVDYDGYQRKTYKVVETNVICQVV